MVRVSHPRTVVSLAVATWVQLWCGLHRPEVNFSCPLPSKDAELASFPKEEEEEQLLLEEVRGSCTHRALSKVITENDSDAVPPRGGKDT